MGDLSTRPRKRKFIKYLTLKISQTLKGRKLGKYITKSKTL